MRFLPTLLFALLLLAAPLVAHAEPPLPYWASLRAGEVNMRVGPGEDYKILWVYRRQHLPVRVLRAMEGWRLVQDHDGARGWVLLRLLSRERSFLVVGRGEAELREKAQELARQHGFDACGIAPALASPLREARLKTWLEAGFEGEMSWMAREPEKRASPPMLWSEA